MALAIPPPSDRKRVKVYELRNNDWFDRGTGFCLALSVNVRARLDWIDVLDLILWASWNGTLMFDADRMSLGFTSSRKTNRIGCCWKPRSRKMMAIKNSKVLPHVNLRADRALIKQ